MRDDHKLCFPPEFEFDLLPPSPPTCRTGSTAVGIEYIAQARAGQQLAWTYRNPVITTGGDTIDNDSLNGLDTYMGFGVAFRRSERFTLFSEAGFGGSILSSKTDEGFQNDVLDDFAYFSIKGGFSLRF